MERQFRLAGGVFAGCIDGSSQLARAVVREGAAAFNVCGAGGFPVIGIQAQGASVVGCHVAGKRRACRDFYVSAAVERAAAAGFRPVAGEGDSLILDDGAGVNRTALGKSADRVVFIDGRSGNGDLAVVQRASPVARFFCITDASSGIDDGVAHEESP